MHGRKLAASTHGGIGALKERRRAGAAEEDGLLSRRWPAGQCRGIPAEGGRRGGRPQRRCSSDDLQRAASCG